jgi:hypothetical protein
MARLQYIKDVLGNNYVGIDVYAEEVAPYLQKLKDYIDDDKQFEILTANQKLRDHDKWHITVINVFDYNDLAKSLGMKNFLERLDNIFKMEVNDIDFKGIGRAERNGNEAYFVVCQSDFLNSIRDSFKLNPIDLHCTLGFNRKDVHGVRKNEILENKPKFLKTISNLYHKDKSLSFINDIQNLGMKLDNIEVLSITDTVLTIRSNDVCYGISLINTGDEDVLRIVSQYADNGSKSINQYQIEKILGKL